MTIDVWGLREEDLDIKRIKTKHLSASLEESGIRTVLDVEVHEVADLHLSTTARPGLMLTVLLESGDRAEIVLRGENVAEMIAMELERLDVAEGPF